MHIARKTLLSACLSIFVFVSVCCAPNAEDTSTVKHDFGRVANDHNPLNWAVISLNDHAKWNSLRREQFLAEDHPLVERMATWNQRIYSQLLQLDPQIALVPQPRIAIAKSPVMNAWVSRIISRLDVSLKVVRPDNTDSTGELWPAAIMVRSAGMWMPYTKEALPSSLDIDKQKELFAWTLAPLADCKVNWTGNTALISALCAEKGQIPMPGGAQALDVMQTGNWITINTGLVKFNENLVIAALTHEMVHYYMSHATATPRLYDYYYLMGTTNPDSKPKDVKLDGNYITNAQSAFTFIAKVPGQKYHSSLFLAMYLKKELFKAPCLGDEQTCMANCQSIQKFWDDNLKHMNEWGRFPLGFLPEKRKSDYFAYEQFSRQCFSGLKPTDEAFDALAELKGLGLNFGPRESFTTAATLDDAFLNVTASLDQSLDEANASAQAGFDRAFGQGLGLYTAEQEADELAIEILARVGINPTALADLMMIFAEKEVGSRSKPTIGQIPFEECREKMAPWQAGNIGAPIPLGDYREPHHSSCFRAYNVYRELKAHAQRLQAIMAAKPEPPVFETTWDAAIEQVPMD